jgi:cytochrome c oxidase cbb3-type subunit III
MRPSIRTCTLAAVLSAWAVNAAAQAGPLDRPTVDAAAADRGRKIYAAECITCHGTQARGTDTGSNLIRSLVVLRDRYGSALGPFLKKGHSMQSGQSSATLTDAQVKDLANFIRQRVEDTLRGSPIFIPQNLLTGDPKAGAAYFEGEGKCTTCHSTSGNLAQFGSRYQPVDIQQRFIFPGSGRGGRGGGGGRGRGGPPAPPAPNPNAVRVTVTPSGSQPVSGVLVQMDDFLVSLRGEDGTVQTFRRVPGMTVVKTNPLQFHIDLLDRITDKTMHDVVAYLETLK